VGRGGEPQWEGDGAGAGGTCVTPGGGGGNECMTPALPDPPLPSQCTRWRQWCVVWSAAESRRDRSDGDVLDSEERGGRGGGGSVIVPSPTASAVPSWCPTPARRQWNTG